MRGVGCCGTKVGTAVGMFACMNHSVGGYTWLAAAVDGIGTEITGVSVEVIGESHGAGMGDAAHSHVSACIVATGFACMSERASVAGRSAWNVGGRDWRGAGVISAGVESVRISCSGSMRDAVCCHTRAYSAVS